MAENREPEGSLMSVAVKHLCPRLTSARRMVERHRKPAGAGKEMLHRQFDLLGSPLGISLES